MKILSLSVLAASLLTSSAFAARSDCRVKVNPTYQMSQFVDIDTFKTTYEITQALTDRKHGFDISQDADAPYVLTYTILADGKGKDASVGYHLSFQGTGVTRTEEGNTTRTARKEKNQVKVYNSVVKSIIAGLPACPNR